MVQSKLHLKNFQLKERYNARGMICCIKSLRFGLEFRLTPTVRTTMEDYRFINSKVIWQLTYEGYSKSNAPNFIMYRQIIVVTCIIYQKKGTSVRITFLLLHIVSTSLKSYSPPMNEGMYTSVVELSRLMSKPIQDSSFHFIVIAISVAPESFFHWTKEVVV